MKSANWNFYANQELRGMIAESAIRCPLCSISSQGFQVRMKDSRPFKCLECFGSFDAATYHASLRRVRPMGTSILYRPVGQNELKLIEESGFRRFPARLDWQPIFYPVLTQGYADVIARDWNSVDAAHGFVGFVTRFSVSNEFLSGYEIRPAADKKTLEYWIPAEELEDFNDNIVGQIEVIAEFRNGVLAGAEPMPTA